MEEYSSEEDLYYLKNEGFIGSFSYGIICFVFGILTESNSYVVVLIGGCIFAALTALMCLIIRNNYNKADKKEITKEDKK